MIRALGLLVLFAASPAFSQATVVNTCGTGALLAIGSVQYPKMDKRGYLCVFNTTTMADPAAAPPPEPEKLEPKK